MMSFSLSPALLIAASVVAFVVLHLVARMAMPFAFVCMAVLVAFLADFGFPFRHLLEGGFGFFNLIMALFAGAFFGQAVRLSGGADVMAEAMIRLVGGRRVPVLILAAAPMFVIGMFSGLAGVAVLAGGIYAVPALRRLGYRDAVIAAFIAVVSVAGMIAPPVNVPAMMIADGVNMPFANVSRSLLALSVPLLLAAFVWFAILDANGARPATEETRPGTMVAGLLPLVVIVGIWLSVRLFGTVLPDPASPLILVLGGLAAFPFMKWPEHSKIVPAVFSGTPLLLAAILVSIGMFIQVFTMSGARGWFVVQVMSLGPPWNYVALSLGLPLLGGVLSSLGSSAILAVPVAFSFLGQNMILNAAALSGISALSEFVAPTAVSAALACYVVGGAVRIRDVVRWSWPPLAVLLACCLLMLIFAIPLARLLT